MSASKLVGKMVMDDGRYLTDHVEERWLNGIRTSRRPGIVGTLIYAIKRGGIVAPLTLMGLVELAVYGLMYGIIVAVGLVILAILLGLVVGAYTLAIHELGWVLGIIAGTVLVGMGLVLCLGILAASQRR